MSEREREREGERERERERERDGKRHPQYLWSIPSFLFSEKLGLNSERKTN